MLRVRRCVALALLALTSIPLTVTGCFEDEDGAGDEVRISTRIHSQAWITAQFDGMEDKLLTFGAETPAP